MKERSITTVSSDKRELQVAKKRIISLIKDEMELVENLEAFPIEIHDKVLKLCLEYVYWERKYTENLSSQ